jgi:hypothetical protein
LYESFINSMRRHFSGYTGPGPRPHSGKILDLKATRYLQNSIVDPLPAVTVEAAEVLYFVLKVFEMVARGDSAK